MARCTAPIYGHRTASGRAKCPACGGYSGYNAYSRIGFSYSNSYNNAGNRSKILTNRTKARWSSSSSTVLYTTEEIRTLTPIRKTVESRSEIPDLRDVFLCHAWDDRKNIAKELHDILEENGVSVWFSEKDVPLGTTLLREIDKGLINSKIGIVLVTPSFINRIKGEGVAEKELSALLARDILVPILHDTTFEALRDVSPLLGSRSGLSTESDSMDEIAKKIAELVSI